MAVATHNEIMNETCGILAQMNMSRRERAIAEARERYLFEKRSAYSAGVNSHARQVATKLLTRNATMSDIVDLSGLSEQEILKLAKDMGLQ